MLSQLQHGEQHRKQPALSDDLDGGEQRRSGMPLTCRDSAMLDSCMPHRLCDGCLASMGRVLAHLRLWHSGTNSCDNVPIVGRRGCMHFNTRRTRMFGSWRLSDRLRNRQLGRLVHLQSRVCIWELATHAAPA